MLNPARTHQFEQRFTAHANTTNLINRICLGIGHIQSTWGITRGCRPEALPSLQQQRTEIIYE